MSGPIDEAFAEAHLSLYTHLTLPTIYPV